tara:strand:+ start:2353 stop:3024 length:672 start_codon:yes stop_codon:yes gene_type:complete
MKTKYTDFNQAGDVFAGTHSENWIVLDAVLSQMPLHIKESQQRGIEGSLIFDPVGTNAYIKKALENHSWGTNTPIPSDYQNLGTDVDFTQSGILVEVQFSNYPFVANNAVRTEILRKAKQPVGGHQIDGLVIVTKAHMFPASNSTLYYEQAVSIISQMDEHGVLDVPIRVVGLFEDPGSEIPVRNLGKGIRYSRDLTSQETGQCRVVASTTERGRCSLTMTEK